MKEYFGLDHLEYEHASPVLVPRPCGMSIMVMFYDAASSTRVEGRPSEGASSKNERNRSDAAEKKTPLNSGTARLHEAVHRRHRHVRGPARGGVVSEGFRLARRRPRGANISQSAGHAHRTQNDHRSSAGTSSCSRSWTTTTTSSLAWSAARSPTA